MMHLSGSPTLARVGSRLCKKRKGKHTNSVSQETLPSQQHLAMQLLLS